MALAQTSSGLAFSAPWLGRTSIASGPGLGTGMTIAYRVRWSVTTTTLDYTGAFMSAGTVATNQAFFTQRQASGAGGTLIGYRWTGSAAQTAVATASGAFGSTTAWVHVCWVYDQASALVRSYVNGVASGTGASAVGAVTNTVTTLGIGPYSGNICDVLFMKRALTASEVNQLALRRAPIFRTGADTVGWYPMTDSSSVTALGTDYSGNGNHLTIQASGAANPTAASVSVPVGYASLSNRFFVAPTMLVPDGDTSVTGAVSLLAQLAESGTSNVTGVVSLQAALAAAGTTNVKNTGAPFDKLFVFLTPVGSTQSSGAVALGATLPISAAGTTNVTGLSSLTAPLAAAGTVSVSGADTLTAPLAATGLTQVTGADVLRAPLAALGTTNVAGSSSLLAALTAAGSVQTSGSSSFGTGNNGVTNVTGAASLLASLAAAGSTSVSGSAVIMAPLLAAGMTQVNGSVVLSGGGAGGGGYVIPLPYSLGRTRQLAQGRPQRRRSR